MIKTKCQECGVEMEANFKSYVLKFCSKKCLSIGRSKRTTGVKHTNWKAKPSKQNLTSRRASDRMFERFGNRKVHLYSYLNALEKQKERNV